MSYRCLLHVAEEFHEIPVSAVQMGKKRGCFIIRLGGETHILRANIPAPPVIRRARPESIPPGPRHVNTPGVGWNSRTEKWFVRMKDRNGKRKWIGSFLDENAAIKALEAAAITSKQV